jgi:hypothetical protein
MLIEFGTEWTLNQSDEFKVINSVGTLSHASTLKRMRTQQKTSSARCNTHVGDLLDGAVLIPYTDCLWNDTRLPNCRFCTK